MVDEKLLADVQAMGFPEVRARKALMSGKTNVEAALAPVVPPVMNEPLTEAPPLANDDPAPVPPS